MVSGDPSIETLGRFDPDDRWTIESSMRRARGKVSISALEYRGDAGRRASSNDGDDFTCGPDDWKLRVAIATQTTALIIIRRSAAHHD